MSGGEDDFGGALSQVGPELAGMDSFRGVGVTVAVLG